LALLYLTALLFGLAIGSFMNVCIFRIPEKRSIVSPPSACMKCGNQLKARHNIPVVSYLVLGGRCAFCGTRISVQYPLVELANGLLYVLAVYVFGPNLHALGVMAMASVFSVGAVISFERSAVPVSVSVFALIVSLPAGPVCFGLDYAWVLSGMVGGAILSALAGLSTRQRDIYSLVLFGVAAGAVTGPYGAAVVCIGAFLLWTAVSVAGSVFSFGKTHRMLSGFTCLAALGTLYGRLEELVAGI